MQLIPDFANDYTYFIHNRELLAPVLAATFWRLDAPFDDFTTGLKSALDLLLKLLALYLVAFYSKEFNLFHYMEVYGLSEHGVLSSTVLLYTLFCTMSYLKITSRYDILKIMLIVAYLAIHFGIFKGIVEALQDSSGITQLEKDEEVVCYALLGWIVLYFITTRIQRFKYRGIYVFISYRRKDSNLETRNIYYYLVRKLGIKRVFMDKSSIPFGVNFEGRIGNALSHASVVLVVIGPTWISASNGFGKQRIHEIDDPVRMEIKLALTKGIPIIPLLVNGAMLPSPEDLPEDLRLLPKFNGQVVRKGVDSDFEEDMDRVMACFIKLKPISDKSIANSENIFPKENNQHK